MLTEQERSFLETMAKTPMPTDVHGLRTLMETFAPMMNQNLPEIGALHEAVEIAARSHRRRRGAEGQRAASGGRLSARRRMGRRQSEVASQARDAIRRSWIPDDQCRLSARAGASVSRGARGLRVRGEVGRRECEALERRRVAAGGWRRFGGRQSYRGDGHVVGSGEICGSGEAEGGAADLRAVRFSRGYQAGEAIPAMRSTEWSRRTPARAIPRFSKILESVRCVR